MGLKRLAWDRYPFSSQMPPKLKQKTLGGVWSFRNASSSHMNGQWRRASTGDVILQLKPKPAKTEAPLAERQPKLLDISPLQDAHLESPNLVSDMKIESDGIDDFLRWASAEQERLKQSIELRQRTEVLSKFIAASSALCALRARVLAGQQAIINQVLYGRRTF